MRNQVGVTIYFKLKFKHLTKVVNNVRAISILQILLAQRGDFTAKMNKNLIMILGLIQRDKIWIPI